MPRTRRPSPTTTAVVLALATELAVAPVPARAARRAGPAGRKPRQEGT